MPVPEFLNQAARRPHGAYDAMPAHELTERCGFKVRMFAEVAAIREMLGEAGLRTEPDFATAGRDEIVRLVPLTHGETSPPTPESEPEADEEDGFELPQVAPKVRNLASAYRELVHLRPDATVDYAMGLLFKHGHRQLPILSTPAYCPGMVTWESIAQSAYGQRNASVLTCKVPAETTDLDEDLFAIRARVTETGCALVRDEHGIYCGIVTARDVMAYLANILEPFYVIGEIERRIRRRLNEQFTQADRDHFGDPYHFAFGKYLDILRNSERFARLGWPTNQALFIDQMDRVRRIRNTVMHFNGDGPPQEDIDALHYFRRWLVSVTPGH